MLYANGDFYDGLWQSNVKYGYGIMQYSNGTIYEGEWQDDSKLEDIITWSIYKKKTKK